MRALSTGRWLMAVVAAGLLFRVWGYAVNRSLWVDELFLWAELGPSAPSTLAHWARVFQPMKTQIAAPGFVLVTQLLRGVGGDAEWALRFAPLVFGCASVLLAARLFTRLLQPATALFAVAVVSCSTIGIYYSADFKPYSADLMFAFLLLDLAVPRLASAAPRIDLALWSAGVLAVFVSLPSIMVLAGVGAAFVVADVKQLTARRALMNLALAASWAVVFAVQVALLMSKTQGQQWLHDYWVGVGAFPPEGSGVLGALAWLPVALLRALGTPVGFGGRWQTVTVSTWAAAGFALWGAVALVRAQRRLAVLLLSPVAFALLAGLVGRYPFQGRVICFVVPALTCCVAFGVEQLAAALPSRPRLVAVVGALLVAESLALALWHLGSPFYREESRPVLAWARSVRAPGDTFFATRDAALAWQYYAPRLGLDDAQLEVASVNERQTERMADDMVARLAGRGRVYFFITHYYGDDDARPALLQALGARGVRVVRSFEDVSAMMFELDFSRPTD